MVFCSLSFYKPQSLGTVFSILFENEHFNPVTSPNRVHQIMWRARSWLSENGLGLEIAQDDAGYKLQFKGNVSLMVPFERQKVGANHQLLRRLEAALPLTAKFQFDDVRLILGISQTSFHRFVRWAADESLIEISGQGRATYYEFKRTLISAA